MSMIFEILGYVLIALTALAASWLYCFLLLQIYIYKPRWFLFEREKRDDQDRR
jgi:hypothetical protein